jgi:hypothetical protein
MFGLVEAGQMWAEDRLTLMEGVAIVRLLLTGNDRL